MTERITYYSTPQTIYDPSVDYVKGASLSGGEVDLNFNTLEGRTIKKVELVGDALEITLLNGRVLSCSMSGVAAVRSLSFDYDRENGTLRVFVNGSEEPTVIGGFVSERELRRVKDTGVLSDNTLSGNGTPTFPLSVAHAFRPGMVKPVINYVEELPTEGMSAGDRYVTKENIDVYGALYNYKGVLSIMKSLEGTPWRVARKEDWDDMLNALEPEFADRNHHLHECNVYLGESANHYIDTDNRDFNLVYCGYAYEEEDLHVVYNGTRVGWWTATHDDDKSAYMKRIDLMADGVYQDIVDGKNFYSVRLVRDVMPDETAGAEEIMGKVYNTSLMPSLYRGLRLWTSTNFTSDLEPVTEEYETTETTTDCNGETTTTTTVTTEVIDDMTDAIYRPEEYPASVAENYICEWNGSRWIKYRVDKYDAFYVTEMEGFFFLSDDGLVSINDLTPIDIEDRVEALENRADGFDTAISELDSELGEMEEVVNGHSVTIGSVIDELNETNETLGDVTIMAQTAAGRAVNANNRVDELERRVDRLQCKVMGLIRLHTDEMGMLYISDALGYTYDDYTYSGTAVQDGLSVNYTLSADVLAHDERAMVSDLARLLGAFWRTDMVTPFEYKGVEYEWDYNGELKGSNYKDLDGVTLVHEITEDYKRGHRADGSWSFTLMADGAAITVNIELA